MNFQIQKPKYRLLFFAGLLLTTGAISTAQAPKTTQAPKKCLMWKAVSGSNVVYLLGSIHLGSKDMYPLPKVIDDAFARSKAMVVEIDLNNMDQTAVNQFVTTNGMYTGDDTLWAHLSKPTADKAKKFFVDYGIPEGTASKFKPWLASVMASLLPMMKAGADPNLGIDKHFLDLANGKKKIEQAESADFQLKLLSSLPDDIADANLSYTIGEVARSKEEDMKIERMWKQGDAEALDAAISDHPKVLDSLMRSMREDRNPHMADVAEKYLKGGGPCFFVVGAAHLIGKEGVIAILQKRGYTVYQLAEK